MAQEQKQVVQLSGLVVAGDGTEGKAGVAVFVPGTTRGTHTNENGFFSLPVLAGDSVIFGALGYRRQSLVVPERYGKPNYTLTIQLHENTTLPTVEVMPWATERDLKEAVAKMKAPVEKEIIIIPETPELKSILDARPMDATANFHYFNQQQAQQQQSRYMVPNIIKGLSLPIRYRK